MVDIGEINLAVFFFRRASVILTTLDYSEMAIGLYMRQGLTEETIEDIHSVIYKIQNPDSAEYAEWEDSVSFLNLM